ncbi:unnamed protein product [Paramecium primaurelia]|uniref:PHD-type domain-containing protein n=1 Tax=Paramecium primaurelia TaxID=5886 RepID=A0A8S1JYC0_PARPR|nr:unnamed protein product [Paramecium primaurelia]
MSSQELHKQAINENEIAYDSNQATSKKGRKHKKLEDKQELKKPIDGKQQFGDKSICRLCQVSTMSTLTIICIRCHFKYHQECIRKQNKEPQFQDGIKWHCLSCIDRIAKRKLKESKPQKKKQCNQIQEFFQKTLQPQEDKIKKLTEFQILYPTYIQQGRVTFPILDEYLTAYQGLFNIEPKKKPALRIDPAIPQEIFEDVLKIWDSYNNMNEIISDILQEQQMETQLQTNNIGTLIHFQDNHTLYNQKSRIEIYLTLQHNPQELILFFCYFYLKQLIEDLDIEQMQKQQYKIPYWQLMGYLWYTNRQRYYQLIRDDVKSLPTNIFKQGILYLPDYLIDFGDYKNINKLTKLVIALVDGIETLKRTQFLYQYRTENILTNNRMKTQLGIQIKEQRSKQMEINKEIIESDGNYQMAKSKLLEDGLSRVETQKFIKQKESAQKQCQKLKQQSQKLEKEINILIERFNQQEKELAIIQISSLVLNPSVFLGYDNKNSQYYFFLWESDKIFVCMKHSIIDDEVSQWGYYDITDINILMEVFCQKGVKENSLRNNILELQRAKLLIVYQNKEEEEQKEDKLKNSQNNSEIDDAENNSNNSVKDNNINSLENLDIDMLIQEFLNIENMLTEYLNQRNSRWCSSEIRNQFLKSFQNVIVKKLDKNYNEQDLAPFCKAIEYFVDNTMLQEKLELRPEEEVNEDENLQLNKDDESYQQQNRKRKVVEDDSSAEQPLQTALQQLEQLDTGKVRIRKLPMKLFGTYYETLRLNLIEQLKKDCNLVKLKICLEILGQIIQDYLNRKITQQIVTQIPDKKKVEEINVKKQIPIEPIIEPEIKVQNLRQRVKFQQQSIYMESKWDDKCKKCGLGGKVICCDTCPKVFHTKCLGLKEVPKGKWNCLVCLSNFERQVKTRATIKKLENH